MLRDFITLKDTKEILQVEPKEWEFPSEKCAVISQRKFDLIENPTDLEEIVSVSGNVKAISLEEMRYFLERKLELPETLSKINEEDFFYTEVALNYFPPLIEDWVLQIAFKQPICNIVWDIDFVVLNVIPNKGSFFIKRRYSFQSFYRKLKMTLKENGVIPSIDSQLPLEEKLRVLGKELEKLVEKEEIE